MTQFLEDELSNGLWSYGIHHRYGLFHIFLLFLRILVKSNCCKRKNGAWLGFLSFFDDSIIFTAVL